MDQGWGHPDRIRWTTDDLAETIGVAASTVQRWQTGETCPQLKGLRMALASWKLNEIQRHALLAARQVSYDEKKVNKEHRANHCCNDNEKSNDEISSSMEFGMVSSEEGGDVDRRDLLVTGAKVVACASIARIASLDSLLDLSDVDQRYNALKALAESVIIRKYDWRLGEARRLDNVCRDAVLQNPSRDNHDLAAMAATMHAILLRPTCAREALQVAARARLNACYGGRNLVRIWAASAFALNATTLGRHDEAISTLEQAIQLVPERGTRLVFAASTLAEAYGARGDVEKVNKALFLADKARRAAVVDDEFRGTMKFLPEHHLVHAGQALLSTGQYAKAIRVSGDALDIYKKLPQRERSPWYMMEANLSMATASARMGEWDAVEHHTREAISFIDRPSQRNFRELLTELRAAEITVAVDLRDEVERAVS